MNKLMKKKKKGFTLIELIAVIAILAILAVVAVPRVVTYVEKSKKVAIQTEASTIYNAAEAAYNDGKLTNGDGQTAAKITKADFDTADLANIVASLKSQNLLSGNTDLAKFGEKVDNLKELKALMSVDVNNISVEGNVLTGDFNSTTGAYEPVAQ